MVVLSVGKLRHWWPTGAKRDGRERKGTGTGPAPSTHVCVDVGSEHGRPLGRLVPAVRRASDSGRQQCPVWPCHGDSGAPTSLPQTLAGLGQGHVWGEDGAGGAAPPTSVQQGQTWAPRSLLGAMSVGGEGGGPHLAESPAPTRPPEPEAVGLDHGCVRNHIPARAAEDGPHPAPCTPAPAKLPRKGPGLGAGTQRAPEASGWGRDAGVRWQGVNRESGSEGERVCVCARGSVRGVCGCE